MDPRVQLGHMSCLVQSGNNAWADGIREGEENEKEKGDDKEEEVTFLYKLCPGSSPRSYGINVARLAGLPQAVLDLAREKSKSFERSLLQTPTSSPSSSAVADELSEVKLTVVSCYYLYDYNYHCYRYCY